MNLSAALGYPTKPHVTSSPSFVRHVMSARDEHKPSPASPSIDLIREYILQHGPSTAIDIAGGADLSISCVQHITVRNPEFIVVGSVRRANGHESRVIGLRLDVGGA